MDVGSTGRRSSGDGPQLSRRTLFRAAAAGAVALGGAATLSSCGTSAAAATYSAAKDSGAIKVGITGERPYSFIDEDGKVTGEGPEVARAVLKRLGITELQGVLVESHELIQGLRSGRFAFAAAGMAITEERCQDALFSIPDYQAKHAFLVQEENANKSMFASFKDFKEAEGGPLLAVLTGGDELGYAIEAGIAEERIVSLSDLGSLMRAVGQARVAAGVAADTTVGYLLAENPGARLAKTSSFLPPKAKRRLGGFTFAKHDTEFRDAFNGELQKLKDSGEWLDIVKPFGFDKNHAPSADMSADVCTA